MNPLEAIFVTYTTTKHALKVVRRCSDLKTIDEDRPFRNTGFNNKAKKVIDKLLTDSEKELDDLTVLSLYATFERSIENDLSARIRNREKSPHSFTDFDRNFSQMIIDWFFDSMRMDEAVQLYKPITGKYVFDNVALIRKYRHWIAHGKSGTSLSKIDPKFAYDILTEFLKKSGIVE